MDLTVYKMRYGGKAQRIFSLPNRENLSAAESMMASLLSRSAGSSEAFAVQDESMLHSFLDLVSENELTGFVLETVYLLKLEQRIKSLSIDHHGTRVDLLTLLTRQAGLEAIKFEKFEKKFLQFLEIIEPLNDRLVWLKGIVTSRTCYSSPEYRLSGDFDCFVDPKYFEELFKCLYEHDFRVIAGDTGFCNQLGVGPVGSIQDLFLVPSSEFVPSAVCGMYRNRFPILDVKLNPLDRGLRMIELDRFEKNLISVSWRGTKFSAPDLLDQLMIALTHFEKDRFHGWKQLLDIKLLCENVNTQPELWTEFIRRCRVEGIATACAAGLSVARDRLQLELVDSVISELEPKTHGALQRLFTFTVTPLFYWNTSSLITLVVNARFADDKARKFRVLRESIFPSRKFLANYYANKAELTGLSSVYVLILHWLTLFLPGGVVRRTFGNLLWSSKQFGTEE